MFDTQGVQEVKILNSISKTVADVGTRWANNPRKTLPITYL